MNAIITGASRGLGFSMAEAFASEGYNLFITGRSDVKLYHALESLMGRFPDLQIKAKPFDLSNTGSVLAFGEWVLDHTKDIDILINNAGIFMPGNVIDEPEGQLEETMSINLYSAYHLTRALLPAMIKRSSGHIFNISSIAGLQAYPNGGSYSISKFALSGFSKNLREELKPHKIKVTCIYPGAVYTDSWAGSGVKQERIMKPSDIASTILQISKLSHQALVEELIIRPLDGDL